MFDANGSNRTQFVAGFVDAANTDLISNFSAYLDLGRDRIHMGDPDTSAYKNTSLLGFLKFKNQRNTPDDGSWAVRIEDVMYGSPINGTSLDDDYSDLAVIDTMFPGIMVPKRVWSKINETLI